MYCILGEELLQIKAILSPAVHDFFLERKQNQILDTINLHEAEAKYIPVSSE